MKHFNSLSKFRWFTTVILLITFGIGQLWADSYSWTCGVSQTFTAATAVSLNGKSWTPSASGTYSNLGSKESPDPAVQIGSKKSPVRSFTMTSSAISGTISSIVVTTHGASDIGATVSITVGGNSFGGTAQALTSTNGNTHTFNGSASGTIIISWSQPSTSKAMYVKGISVTYSTCTSLASINGSFFGTPLFEPFSLDNS